MGRGACDASPLPAIFNSMRNDILTIASKKFKELSKTYNKFVTVFVDDWRGFRFIYDTEDVWQCKNRCSACPLYNLLKNEKGKTFSAALFPASTEDKRLFGTQRFLNCKTFTQYRSCYKNFLRKKVRTRAQLQDELLLVRNMRIIYVNKGSAKQKEKVFKKSIIQCGKSVFAKR